MAESGDQRTPVAADDELGRRQLEAIYRSEAPRLTRMLRGKLRSAEDSHDLLQDAFARLAGAGSLARLRNPEAYLERIVRNLLIDRSRRAAHRPVQIPIENGLEIPVAPDQAHALEVRQMREQYRALVAALPPRTRQVFLLHRVDELQYTEIAERLQIHVHTVEWHMGEAISKIAKGLERR